jgi:hypothetical protein
MHSKLEFGHDAEIATSSAQSPEQFGFNFRTGGDLGPIRSDQIDANEAVDGQAIAATEPTHSPAESEARGTSVRDDPSRNHQSMWCSRAVQITQQ